MIPPLDLSRAVLGPLLFHVGRLHVLLHDESHSLDPLLNVLHKIDD